MWRDGYQAVSHNVYLASTKSEIDSVSAGDIESVLFKGNFITGEANIYQASSHFDAGSYYWRIDAVQEDGSVVQGNTWKFIVE